MDEVEAHVAALSPESRALYERVHGLVLSEYPGAAVVLSYKMPTFVVGSRRLHVGMWKHGASFYGWDHSRDAGFAARHPELDSGKGTLKLPFTAAATIGDTELRDFLRAALAPLPACARSARDTPRVSEADVEQGPRRSARRGRAVRRQPGCPQGCGRIPRTVVGPW